MTRAIYTVPIVIISLVILLLVFVFLPVTYVDWMRYLRPAALNWRQPYLRGVYNPPWLFYILRPLALLPPRPGVALLIVLTFVIVCLYVRSPWKAFLVGVSAPMVALITVGQVDGLLVLGLAIPGGLGLPLLLTKPQGVFLAVLRRLNRWSLLVTVVFVTASLLVWGRWWPHLVQGQSVVGSRHNVSLFPYSVPVGVVLLLLGIRQRSDALLCVASLCFAPYFQMASALPAIAAMVKEDRFVLGTFVATWAYFLLVPH